MTLFDVPVVPRRGAGVWITNGQASWHIPDRRVAAWLHEKVICCPEGWWIETRRPAVGTLYLMAGSLVVPVKEGPCH